MPEPVELCVRRGKRSRMAVTEADDRDAREQVEVALSVGIDEPGTVAVRERDVVAGVGRQHPVEARDLRHAITAVLPIVAVIPLAAARAAARSFGMIPPSNAPSASIRRASPTAIASTISSST